MSGLVDIWTSEEAKLREREKGQPTLSNGSNPVNKGEEVGPPAKEGNFLAGKVSSFLQEMQVKALVLPYSEASVSMLVECFSP